MYQGSADWMRRNLYRRIEVVFPVVDDAVRNQVEEMLRIQLADNVKATLIIKNGRNKEINKTGDLVQAQRATYAYLGNSEART